MVEMWESRCPGQVETSSATNRLGERVDGHGLRPVQFGPVLHDEVERGPESRSGTRTNVFPVQRQQL